MRDRVAFFGDVAILAPEGQDVAVGQPLCRFEGGDAAEPDPSRHCERLRSNPDGPHGAAGLDRFASARDDGSRERATPPARRLAASHGLALSSLRGTGGRERIEARDVRAAAATPPTARSASAPVLLLHGFGGDSRTWTGLTQHLLRVGRQVAAPDLAGHTRTALVEAATIKLDALGWGLENRIIAWQQAIHAGSRIALHLIPGAGHMAHWDKPEEVAALFA